MILKRFFSRVPVNKLEVSFSRSSGPGGQAVNKQNTKVDLRFKLSEADWIPEATKTRLNELYSNNINKEGELYVSSQKYRNQKQNYDDAVQKIEAMIEVASKPKVERVIKMKEETQKEEDFRIKQKKRRSEFKQLRSEKFEF